MCRMFSKRSAQHCSKRLSYLSIYCNFSLVSDFGTVLGKTLALNAGFHGYAIENFWGGFLGNQHFSGR